MKDNELGSAVQIIKAQSRRTIAFNPIYKDITGSITGALFLSQLCWHADKANFGEFCLTDPEAIKETHLGSREFINAKKAVSQFVRVEIRGVPPKTHYVVDFEKIAEAILNYAETAKLILPKRLNQSCRNGKNIRHEDLRQEDLREEKKDMNKIKNTAPSSKGLSVSSSLNYSDDFLMLWEARPRKYRNETKKKAYRKYKQTLTKYSHQDLVGFLDRFNAQTALHNKCGGWPGTFPYLATWLHDEPWLEPDFTEEQIIANKPQQKVTPFNKPEPPRPPRTKTAEQLEAEEKEKQAYEERRELEATWNGARDGLTFPDRKKCIDKLREHYKNFPFTIRDEKYKELDELLSNKEDHPMLVKAEQRKQAAKERKDNRKSGEEALKELEAKINNEAKECLMNYSGS